MTVSQTGQRDVTMTCKQSLFVQEYYNAPKAAIRAGHSAKTAQVQGSRLLSNVMVQAALTEAQAARLRTWEMTLERLDRETEHSGDVGSRRMMRAGEWVPLQDIPDDLAPPPTFVPVLLAHRPPLAPGAEAVDSVPHFRRNRKIEGLEGRTDVNHPLHEWVFVFIQRARTPHPEVHVATRRAK